MNSESYRPGKYAENPNRHILMYNMHWSDVHPYCELKRGKNIKVIINKPLSKCININRINLWL